MSPGRVNESTEPIRSQRFSSKCTTGRIKINTKHGMKQLTTYWFISGPISGHGYGYDFLMSRGNFADTLHELRLAGRDVSENFSGVGCSDGKGLWEVSTRIGRFTSWASLCVLGVL